MLKAQKNQLKKKVPNQLINLDFWLREAILNYNLAEKPGHTLPYPLTKESINLHPHQRLLSQSNMRILGKEKRQEALILVKKTKQGGNKDGWWAIG